jgi:hypothetical protein
MNLGVGFKKIRISRHAISGPQQLTFGLLNVQSANNKIDDIIDTKRESIVWTLFYSHKLGMMPTRSAYEGYG